MIFRFGPYSLDSERLELWNRDDLIAVQPQVFSLLVFLVENRERVVSKDEIFESVWDGRIVSDATLNARLNAARRAVGDSGKDQDIIRTFPRKGFRFVAMITGQAIDFSEDARPEHFDRPSVAVLPFANLSNDLDQEYFSDGLSEDIITALSHVREFFVFARNTTFAYRGQTVDFTVIAGQLGVDYLLDGSVRRADRRVRVTATLIDCETKTNIWAEKYDRDLEDIFELQDDITRMVVGAIEPELNRQEQSRARRKPSEDLDAWDMYQQGVWHCWHDTKDHNDEAVRLLTQAIIRDSEFCQAHAFLALSLWRRVILQLTATPQPDLEEALRLSEKAISLDQGNAHAHWAAGAVYMQLRNHELAREELGRAVRLNPSFAHAYQYLGWTMVYDNEPEEGIRMVQLAQALSPNDPVAWGMILIQAQAHVNKKDFAQAEKLARQAKLLADNLPVNCTILASSGYTGNTKDAGELIAKVMEIAPDFAASKIKDVFPFKHQVDIDTWTAGLCLSGVPEG